MGKRRRREYEYDMYRKFRKLEKKLDRYWAESPSPDREPSDYYEYASDVEDQDVREEDATQSQSNNTVEGQLAPEPHRDQPVAGPSSSSSVPPPEPIAGPSTTQATPVTAPITTQDPENIDEEMSLEPEILALLGEDPTQEKNFGENLHKDIAPRWTHILGNGLNKESKLELIRQYLPAENCPNMRAPKLNLEIKAALLETNTKRDLFSQTKQNQLASSLAAIGQTLNWALSSKNVVPPNILKCLSDAGRLICDNHYRESQARRYAALNTLNKDIRDTVKNTNIDEYLFGSALSDHIKSSKAITKTGSEIKSRIQRPAFRTPPTSQPRGALNSRGAPPRVASAVEQRSTPTVRRPPRDRRQAAPRGRPRRHPTNYTRQPQARRQ